MIRGHIFLQIASISPPNQADCPPAVPGPRLSLQYHTQTRTLPVQLLVSPV